MNAETVGMLAATAALFVLPGIVFAILHAKARARAEAGESEVSRLSSELEVLNRTSALKEESFARRLADKDEACRRTLEDKAASCRALLAEKDAACQKLLAEKGKAFEETVKALQERFSTLAAAKMKEQQADLTALNRTQMENVVKPLREQLLNLQELTRKTQSENATLGKSMTGHVEAIGKIAGALSGVAEALHSNTRYQGRKGEEILAEKLRQAGLEENVNFFLQTGSDSDRPDAQVCDTENRWLIIDSKVSLTAYLEYAEASDEKTRAEKLAAHVASVRQKIDQLAKKKYPKVFTEEHRDRNYLPITAMFVPYEAPLMEALRAEPSLWQFAAQNNVVLITPLTLLAYLRLVYLAWQHEKEARNQQAIVDTARELLKRTNEFLKTFEEVGAALDGLQASFGKARAVLIDAPHAQTIANSARRLIDLHVKLESRKGKRIERAACLQGAEEGNWSEGDGV